MSSYLFWEFYVPGFIGEMDQSTLNVAIHPAVQLFQGYDTHFYRSVEKKSYHFKGNLSKFKLTSV